MSNITNMKQRYLPEVSHESSISNEVAKTLYPTLEGIIASLEYDEKKKAEPCIKHLALYESVSEILNNDHRDFYKFNDDQINHKVAILSPIIKEMVAKNKSLRYGVLLDSFEKIKSLS